ncbi:MAG TPA: hypothetical protein VF547_05335 [Allosphingosinicella sp.]
MSSAPALFLLLAAPAAPQPTMVDAARQALMEGCVPHTIARRTIEKKNAAPLVAAGIKVGAPIPDWARTGLEEWGASVPAEVASAEGPVWISAFKAGICSVMFTSGERHSANAEALRRMIEAPGSGFSKVEDKTYGDTVTRFYDSPLKPRGTLRLTFSATNEAAPKGGEMIIASTSRID